MRDDFDDLLIKSREVFAYGEIDEDFARRLTRSLCVLRSENKTSPVTIFLSSPGGAVDFGLGLYDFIQSQAFPVNVVGMGEVASAATLILLAGDRRLLTYNSVLMLHGLTIGVENSVPNVEAYLKSSKYSLECMLDIYTAKSHLTKVQLRNKLQKDWYLNSTEALELGFIDDRI